MENIKRIGLRGYEEYEVHPGRWLEPHRKVSEIWAMSLHRSSVNDTTEEEMVQSTRNCMRRQKRSSKEMSGRWRCSTGNNTGGKGKGDLPPDAIALLQRGTCVLEGSIIRCTEP